MASRMATKKTLFLDEKDYNIFEDFMSLMCDLASNLDDEDIDELQEALEYFNAKIYIEQEED